MTHRTMTHRTMTHRTMTHQDQVLIARQLLIADALAYLDDPDVAVCIPHLLDGLRRYLEDRLETGGFLRACLENDWAEATSHAHPALRMRQMKTLRDVISTFPAQAWGSPEKVVAWLGEGKSGQ